MESRTAFMGHVSRFPVTVFWLIILASVGILIGATTIVPGPPINKPRFISATNVDNFTANSFQVGTSAVYVPLTVDSGGSLRIDPPAGVRNSGWIKVNGATTNIGVTYTDGGIVSGQNVASGPSDVTITDPSTGKYFTYEVLNANSNIVMREPTNGNMGLNYGVMVWTNVNGVTNQRMNFTFGSGITLDWTARTISSSGSSLSSAQLFKETNIHSFVSVGSGGTLASFGNEPNTTTVGAAYLMAATNGHMRGITATNLPNDFSAYFACNGFAHCDTNSFLYEFYFNIESPIVSSNYISFGVSTGVPGNTANPAKAMMFRYNTAPGTINTSGGKWLIYQNDGITTFSNLTTVSFSTNSLIWGTIFKSGSNVVYSLFGTPIVTNAYLPSAGVNVGWFEQDRTADVAITNTAAVKLTHYRMDEWISPQ